MGAIEWFFIGLGVGVTISFTIAEYIARRVHREWMRLMDNNERVLAKVVDIAYEEGVSLEGLKKINEIIPKKVGA